MRTQTTSQFRDRTKSDNYVSKKNKKRKKGKSSLLTQESGKQYEKKGKTCFLSAEGHWHLSSSSSCLPHFFLTQTFSSKSLLWISSFDKKVFFFLVVSRKIAALFYVEIRKYSSFSGGRFRRLVIFTLNTERREGFSATPL